MAKFNPPQSFSFDKPTDWTDWKRQFERYRTATELNKKPGEVQVCSLVYAMGVKRKIFLSRLLLLTEGTRIITKW